MYQFLKLTQVPGVGHCGSLDVYVLKEFYTSFDCNTYFEWFRAYHTPDNGGVDVLLATYQATLDVLVYDFGTNNV